MCTNMEFEIEVTEIEVTDIEVTDIEEETVSTIGIKKYLEMVSPEIREMFVQAYGDDVDAAFTGNPEKKQQVENLLLVLSELRPREQKVIALRFGIFSGKPMTLEEIAKEFGITIERIRQIEGKAFRGYYPHRSRKLRDFLE